MTYKEAAEIIDIAKAEVEWSYPMDYFVAFEIAKDAINKNIGMDATYIVYNVGSNVRYGLCPVCEKGVSEEDNYCPHCGQMLYWGESDGQQ